VRLTLLGTGSPLPDPNRAGPSTLVQAGDANLLVDAGRGVLMRLAGAGLLPPQLSAVLLTHLHSDHITDLNDVITTRWVASPVPLPLPIIGPPGTRQVVDGILAMLQPDIGYRLAHHDDLDEPPQVDVTEVVPGDTIELAGATIRVGRTDHRPVEPTVAYRVEHDGRALVLGGDGVPCRTLDDLCAGADVYVQTAIREDLVAAIPIQRLQDILDYHSSVAQAAQTASRAAVGRLVLTHYVPAPAPGGLTEWRTIAAEHFDGEVITPDDGTVIDI